LNYTRAMDLSILSRFSYRHDMYPYGAL